MPCERYRFPCETSKNTLDQNGKERMIIQLFCFNTNKTAILCFRSGYDFIQTELSIFLLTIKVKGHRDFRISGYFARNSHQLQVLDVPEAERVRPVSEEFRPFCSKCKWQLACYPQRDENIWLSRACILSLVIQQI